MSKRNKVSFLIVGLIGFLLISACENGNHKKVTFAIDGVIDLRNWDFDHDGPVSLTGEWRLYWKNFVNPGVDFDSASGPASGPAYVPAEVPDAWNGLVVDGKKISGHGYGTYRLRIRLRPQNRRLAFKFVHWATACRVFANGRLIFASGKPGLTRETTSPDLHPGIVEFENESDQIDLVIQVANFDHWEGGAWKTIRLGAADIISDQHNKSMLVNFSLLGAMIIMGLYHLVLFINRRDERSTLYFGVFCLLMAARLMATGNISIHYLLPGLSYEVLQKIIYITFYLSITFFVLYLKKLFPVEFSGKVEAFPKYAGIVLSVFVLLAPTRIFSLTMPGVQVFTLLLLLYGVFIVVKALIRKRDGAEVFLVGFLVFFSAVLNDILFTRQIIDTGNYFHIGFFIFIFSQACIISRRFSNAYALIENQSNDLRNINEGYREEFQRREKAEAKLKESERMYRLLAENVSDVLWILDIETRRFTYNSPSVQKARGFTQEEAIAMTVEETLSPESFQRGTELLEQELAKDHLPGVDESRTIVIEAEHSIKGGGYRWVETKLSFIRDDQGNATSILGVTRDIEERKQAEARLLESEKKYKNLFENGSDLLCIHDLDGNLLETNLAFKKEYGWTESDLENLNIRDVLPKGRESEYDEYMKTILANGEVEGILRVKTKTGEPVLLEYRNRLMFDTDGSPVAVQGAGRDITARYYTEKALRESEEKYRGLVRHAPAGIFEFDMRNMNFISVNEVLCDFTGYGEREFVELSPFDLLVEDSKTVLNQYLEEIFLHQILELSTEMTLVSKTGAEKHVQINAKIFYEDGSPVRAMAIVHDLTDIRRAEEEKRKLEAQLQNAKKFEALGTLAGGVAHDLNNILGGLVSYPDYLLHKLEEDSPLRKPLLTIRKSGEKAAEIVRDLLTLTRRGVESRDVINLNLVIREFIDSPEYKEILSNREDIRVETDLREDLLNTIGSGYQLSKVVMNLFANAIDSMPSGGNVTISTKNYYFDQDYQGTEVIPEGEYTVFEISDMGIGISEADLENIFEPFYTKKVMGRSGTGLGMTVVWGTVKDHGGYIDVQSKEGVGTTFRLYIPATRREERIRQTVHIDDYLGKGESILVVDDSEDQRDLAGGMMQRIGYKVDTASSGEEAVEKVKSNTYDLLILDMKMDPGINGLETYERIIQIASKQKAVIASGFAENELVKEAQRLGAGEYIRKPYTLEVIGLAVRNELDRKE